MRPPPHESLKFLYLCDLICFSISNTRHSPAEYGVQSPLCHGNSLGDDLRPVTVSQASLPHRVTVVIMKWRRQDDVISDFVSSLDY